MAIKVLEVWQDVIHSGVWGQNRAEEVGAVVVWIGSKIEKLLVVEETVELGDHKAGLITHVGEVDVFPPGLGRVEQAVLDGGRDVEQEEGIHTAGDGEGLGDPPDVGIPTADADDAIMLRLSTEVSQGLNKPWSGRCVALSLPTFFVREP